MTTAKEITILKCLWVLGRKTKAFLLGFRDPHIAKRGSKPNCIQVGHGFLNLQEL